MPRRKTQEEFIADVKAEWGEDAFDLSQVHYVNNRTAVKVICNTCGESWESKPDNLLHHHGCPTCTNTKKLTRDIFIKKARKIHGDKYDYSKVVWVDRMTEVVITCPDHGDFKQIPKNHLAYRGCKECAKLTMGSERLSLEDFLKKAKEIHGDKYDYSLIKHIKNNREKLPIICKKHGVFPQTAHSHIVGKSGCPFCKPWSMPTPIEEFIKRSRKVHGNQFDYSKVSYKKLTDKVVIICKKCGHEFLQQAANHLSGTGCPHCYQSRGERKVRLTLEKMKVPFKEQFVFHTPLAPGKKHIFKVDFWLEKRNLIIEYNGEQHYQSRGIISPKQYNRQKSRDESLRMFCSQEGYALLEIPFWELNHIEEILEQELKP